MIEYLNYILSEDRATISKMLLTRYPCNKELTDNTIILTNDEGIRFLGILNGLFGLNEEGRGKITMELDTDTNLINKFYET